MRLFRVNRKLPFSPEVRDLLHRLVIGYYRLFEGLQISFWITYVPFYLFNVSNLSLKTGHKLWNSNYFMVLISTKTNSWSFWNLYLIIWLKNEYLSNDFVIYQVYNMVYKIYIWIGFEFYFCVIFNLKSCWMKNKPDHNVPQFLFKITRFQCLDRISLWNWIWNNCK